MLNKNCIKILLLITSAFLLASASYAQDREAIATPGTVALTFDDGPSKEFTKEIVAILNKYHIKATFFVVGEMAAAHPDVVKFVNANGQAIANHTYDHPFLTHLKDAQVNMEIENTQAIIYKLIGKKPVCLRYPYGDYNKRVAGIITQHGLKPIDIDVDSEDYRRQGVKVIVKNVMKEVKSGSVILFHDGPSKREQTVAALPLIIEAIQKKGLKFSQICVE
jgi:peptidoglycan-N-acetylglucosamine deacetylase